MYLKNELMELTFMHIDAESQKLKAGQKLLGWAWLNMAMTSLVMGI